MSIRRTGAAALLLLITVTACRIEKTPRAGLADPVGVARAEVAAALLDYQSALLANEPRRVAASFTAGAHLYLPDTPDIIGRGAIDGAMTASFADAQVVDMAMRSDDIELAAGMAHHFGTFEQRLRDDEGAERSVRGRFVIRWLRAGEAVWQIERMLLNYYPADSAAPAPR